jgi:hypothetical protein
VALKARHDDQVEKAHALGVKPPVRPRVKMVGEHLCEGQSAIEAALVWSWRSANLEEFLRAGLPGADIVRWQQDTANE